MTAQTGSVRYSIPSFNVVFIGKVTFEETTQPTFRGRRDINVKQQCVGNSIAEETKVITIWICTDDMSTVLGPYYLGCNETLSIPVDDGPWIVTVETDYEAVVDVWFS